MQNASDDDHQIPTVPTVNESKPDEDQFTDPIASPAVVGEENVFSGDAPDGEPADIDEEMAKVGLKKDENANDDNF